MGMLRFDHVGVVVDDLDAVAAFFLGLGFECEGRMVVEGEMVDKINGLDGVRAELVMVRTPDGSGKLELVKYHAPLTTKACTPRRRTGRASGTSLSRSMTSTRSSTDCETKALTRSARSVITRTAIGSAMSAVLKD
jgi:catechol 2,3-dioxygenase-like lactoylglutathione lyase family enzyme